MTSHLSIFLMNNDADWRSQFFRIASEVCNQIWEADANEEDAQFEKRWYYSEDSHSCLQFNYGGCLGNENNFDSEEECQARYQCEFSRFISRYILYTVVRIFSMVLVRRIWPCNSQHLLHVDYCLCTCSCGQFVKCRKWSTSSFSQQHQYIIKQKVMIIYKMIIRGEMVWY